MRKTKIICTLGPAVDDIEILRELMRSGMDCARLNFSHGTYQEQKSRIEKIKKLRNELKLPIPILLDTKGPEIRLKDFENGKVLIKKGQLFTFKSGDGLGTKDQVCVTCDCLSSNIKPGNSILADDGSVEFEVIQVDCGNIVCKAKNSGVLSNHKSLNIPNVHIDMTYINDSDKNDVLFGIEQGVDFIAASFARSAEDIKALRELLDNHKGQNIKIIAKIENIEGIKNLEEIMQLSDGIMVARGDMGVEVPFKLLPIIQKDIIKRCYRAGKLVITATQMLESMTHNPRPTRAEISDVANAIFDGTTATMLSGETAVGEYPVESLKTMSEIAESTEKAIDYQERFHNDELNLGKQIVNAISRSSCISSYCLNAKAIVAVSRSGKSAKLISEYRPNCPIVAAVVDETACRQLNLAWNVKPIPAVEQYNTDDLFEHGLQKAAESGMIEKGDIVIITGGSVIGNNDTDMMKIHRV